MPLADGGGDRADDAEPVRSAPAEIQLAARTENFPVASRLLPRAVRSHLLAVYAYARLVDDIGDETAGHREGMLDEIESDVERIYTGSPRLPVVRALVPTVHSCAIPDTPFRRLIEANRQDQRVTRYETFDDLVGYCTLSANPVGELVLHVFGAAGDDEIALSDRICTALQVLEHCQDVGEDYRAGRVYLPQQDLRRHGCAEPDLATGHAAPAVRRVVGEQVRRAGTLLDGGMPLLDRLSGLARLAIAGYVAGGRATVQALRAAGFEVLSQPVRPSAARTACGWAHLALTRKAG